MKKAIIILSVVLVVLVIFAGMLLLSDRQAKPADPVVLPETTAPTTEATTEPTTESTTEEPTQPPVEKTLREAVLFLNGKETASYDIAGAVYLRASDFAASTGLTLESEAPVRLAGTLDTVEFSADGAKMTVNGESAALKNAVVADEDGTFLPLNELVEALGYPVYTDEDITYITPAARRFELPENVNVPVLMYHAVSDDMWGINELFVSPSDMDEQLAYLVENGYDPIWFEDLAHVEDFDKPVILTFDDGYDDNYTELYPLLQKYDVKATIFVIGEAIGSNHKMTEAQIRELADSGLVSIQSHSYTHADMDTLDLDGQHYEMRESKRVITRITGREPYVLCYPTGRYSSLTLEAIGEYYAFGIKMVGNLYNTSDDPHLVNRYYISRYTDIYTFAAYVSNAGT